MVSCSHSAGSDFVTNQKICAKSDFLSLSKIFVTLAWIGCPQIHHSGSVSTAGVKVGFAKFSHLEIKFLMEADFLLDMAGFWLEHLDGDDTLPGVFWSSLFSFLTFGEFSTAPIEDAVLTGKVVFLLLLCLWFLSSGWLLLILFLLGLLLLASSLLFAVSPALLLVVVLVPLSKTVTYAMVLLAFLVNSCHVLVLLLLC